MKLTLAAKLHLIGQCLGLAAQTLLPQLSLPDAMLHRLVAIVAYGQGVAGLWAVFMTPREPPKGEGANA